MANHPKKKDTLQSILFNDSDSSDDDDDDDDDDDEDCRDFRKLRSTKPPLDVGGVKDSTTPHPVVATTVVVVVGHAPTPPQKRRLLPQKKAMATDGLAKEEAPLPKIQTPLPIRCEQRLVNTTTTTNKKPARSESCVVARETKRAPISSPSTPKTTVASARVNENKDDDDDDDETLANHKRQESMKIFLQALLQYLKATNSELYRCAQTVVEECYERNKAGDEAYANLTSCMQQRLLQTVGKAHWRAAIEYLKLGLKQRQQRAQQGQSLSLISQKQAPVLPLTSAPRSTTKLESPTARRRMGSSKQTTPLGAPTPTATSTGASAGSLKLYPQMTPEQLERAIRIRDRIMKDTAENNTGKKKSQASPTEQEEIQTNRAQGIPPLIAAKSRENNKQAHTGVRASLPMEVMPRTDMCHDSAARNVRLESTPRVVSPPQQDDSVLQVTAQGGELVSTRSIAKHAPTVVADGAGWGTRNVVSARAAWARLRLPELAESDAATGESLPQIPGVTPTVVTTPCRSDAKRSNKDIAWKNGVTAEGDAALALVSEATEVYLKRILEGAVGAARQRQNVNGIRLWQQQARAPNKNQRLQQQAPPPPPPLSLLLGCNVSRQVALAQGKAAESVRDLETVLERDAQGAANICTGKLCLESATSMGRLSLRPRLKRAAEEAQHDVKRCFEEYHSAKDNAPLGSAPKRPKIIPLDFETSMSFPSFAFAQKSVLGPY